MSRSAVKMLLLGSLAGLAAAAGAAQASPDEVPTVVVRYNSAAIETDSGARDLYRRLARAAAHVCPNSSPHLIDDAAQKCRTKALADAVEKVHSSRLAALYAAKSKSG